MKNTKWLNISQAADYLGLSEDTLRTWDKSGSLKPTYMTPGGHRRYSMEDLEKFIRLQYSVPSPDNRRFYVQVWEHGCESSESYMAWRDVPKKAIEAMNANQLATEVLAGLEIQCMRIFERFVARGGDQ